MTDATKYTSKLRGSRVLIIGGSSGIGYGAAEACLEYGATVILSSSQSKRLDSAISTLLEAYPSAKSRLSGHACDLGDSKNLESNIKALFESTGEVNHVVFTAGDPLALGPFAETSLDIIQQAGMVRFFAPLLVAKYALGYMPRTASSSITMTSGSIAVKPMPGWAVVNSYATGLFGMTRGLALDLAPIRVNCIAPGAVETPLWNMLPEDQREKLKLSLKEKMTTGAVGRTEDVAEAYLYLLRDENCTGSIISTDGGGLLK